MAKILNRKQIVFQIKQMFYEASEYIYLICPYIDLQSDNYLTPAIEHANNKGIKISLVYSKGREKRDGIEKLKKYDNIKFCYIAGLHMKVYLSDKAAIISSMNLHDFSIKNNLECGILINNDEELWDDVCKMIEKDIYKNMVIEKNRGKKVSKLTSIK
jgi:phosphatidylserine/phosphatidylglycerophosphate/cardiolipin synthase-like enzyme